MPDDFPYLSEYPQLVGGAHRKAALPLGTPALVWHAAFWKPMSARDLRSNIDSSLTADWSKVRREWEIDRYLREIYERIRFGGRPHIENFKSDNEFVFENDAGSIWLTLFHSAYNLTDHLDRRVVSGREALVPKSGIRALSRIDRLDAAGSLARQLERASQYQTINFDFRWRGLAARIRFELCTEYYTVTSFLDFSAPPTRSQTARDSEKGEFDNFASDLIEDAFRNLSTTLLVEGEERKNHGRTTDAFRQIHKDNGSHSTLYHRIWDKFRRDILITDGVYIPRRNEPVEFGRLFADFRGVLIDDEALSSQVVPAAFRLPFLEKSTSPRSARPKTAPQDWAQDTIRKFWSFLSCSDRIEHKRYEFTASTLLHGEAVYVSSLGAQPAAPSEAREPVLFFVSLWARNRWQVGRLVEQLHQLGTLRFAAIIELDRLQKAGSRLRDIEKLIESTRQLIQSNSSVDDSDATKNVIKIVSANVSKMQGMLTETAMTDDDRNLGRHSMAYRLERAAYYIRQFTQGVERLDPSPIEGYQPYNKFVFRRLGSAFNYIELLNERYQRIERETRFFVEYLAAQSSVLQTKRIQTIQTIGDIVLWWVLVPYYAGTLLVEHINIFGFDDPGKNAKTGWEAIWGLSVCVWFSFHVWSFIAKRLKSRKPFPRWPSRLLPVEKQDRPLFMELFVLTAMLVALFVESLLRSR